MSERFSELKPGDTGYYWHNKEVREVWCHLTSLYSRPAGDGEWTKELPTGPRCLMPEEVEDLQAEVERLKALPTAAQERAAIVAWLNRQERWHYNLSDDAKKIEQGEHWPTEGKP